MEYERRYAASFTKFLDATALLHKPENSVQIRELAVQVTGTLETFLAKLKELSTRAHALESLATNHLTLRSRWLSSKSKLEPPKLPYPEDWDLTQPSQQSQTPRPAKHGRTRHRR